MFSHQVSSKTKEKQRSTKTCLMPSQQHTLLFQLFDSSSLSFFLRAETSADSVFFLACPSSTARTRVAKLSELTLSSTWQATPTPIDSRATKQSHQTTARKQERNRERCISRSTFGKKKLHANAHTQHTRTHTRTHFLVLPPPNINNNNNQRHSLRAESNSRS